mgnify:CR=1 FL=1
MSSCSGWRLNIASYDAKITTIFIAHTAIIASFLLPNFTTTDSITDSVEDCERYTDSTNINLYLPGNLQLLASQKESPTSASANINIEQSLRSECTAIAAREKTLLHDLQKEKKQCEDLSLQLQGLLQGYEDAGEYANIFGKSKAMVQREHKGFKSSQDADLHGLRLKLADLEHHATMTRRACKTSNTSFWHHVLVSFCCVFNSYNVE